MKKEKKESNKEELNKEEALRKEIGRRLASCREAIGMTQEEVGNNIFRTRDLITAIENGRRNLTRSNAMLLSDLFGVDVDWLLCESEIKSKEAYTMTEAEKLELKRPIPIRVLIHLIEALPDCKHVAWECSTEGDKKDWGWHIVINMKDGRNLYLDSATERMIFDELVSFMDYQIFKLNDDPRAVDINRILNSPPESFETPEAFIKAWNEARKQNGDEIISKTDNTGRTSREIKRKRKEDD